MRANNDILRCRGVWLAKLDCFNDDRSPVGRNMLYAGASRGTNSQLARGDYRLAGWLYCLAILGLGLVGGCGPIFALQ